MRGGLPWLGLHESYYRDDAGVLGARRPNEEIKLDDEGGSRSWIQMSAPEFLEACGFGFVREKVGMRGVEGGE